MADADDWFDREIGEYTLSIYFTFIPESYPYLRPFFSDLNSWYAQWKGVIVFINYIGMCC